MCVFFSFTIFPVFCVFLSENGLSDDWLSDNYVKNVIIYLFTGNKWTKKLTTLYIVQKMIKTPYVKMCKKGENYQCEKNVQDIANFSLSPTISV